MNRYRFTLGIVTSGLNRAELPSLEGEETILSLSLSLFFFLYNASLIFRGKYLGLEFGVRWASLLS